MAGDIKQKYSGSSTQVQANTSAAIANGAAVALATTFDNRTGVNFAGTFVLTTNGWGATTGIAGTTIDLYGVPAADGTNYGEVDTTTPLLPAPCYLGSFEVIDTNTIQILALPSVPLPPHQLKFYIKNNTGQQMSAGWTVDLYPELEQYT